MRSVSPKTFVLVILLALSAMSGVAAAGSTDTTQPAPKKQLSASEQQRAGSKLLTAALNLSTRLTKMLEQARTDNKIELAACLNDKLTRVDALRAQLRQKYDVMVKATDPETRKHNFTMMGIIGDQVKQLQQLASQCSGAEMYESGGTKVVTEIERALIPFEVDPAKVPVVPASGPPIVSPPATKTGSMMRMTTTG